MHGGSHDQVIVGLSRTKRRKRTEDITGSKHTSLTSSPVNTTLRPKEAMVTESH